MGRAAVAAGMAVFPVHIPGTLLSYIYVLSSSLKTCRGHYYWNSIQVTIVATIVVTQISLYIINLRKNYALNLEFLNRLDYRSRTACFLHFALLRSCFIVEASVSLTLQSQMRTHICILLDHTAYVITQDKFLCMHCFHIKQMIMFSHGCIIWKPRYS